MTHNENPDCASELAGNTRLRAKEVALMKLLEAREDSA